MSYSFMSESGRVVPMGELMLGRWKRDVISFQKIFGLCGLNGHIVKISLGLKLVDGRRETLPGAQGTQKMTP